MSKYIRCRGCSITRDLEQAPSCIVCQDNEFQVRIKDKQRIRIREKYGITYYDNLKFIKFKKYVGWYIVKNGDLPRYESIKKVLNIDKDSQLCTLLEKFGVNRLKTMWLDERKKLLNIINK